MKKLIRVSLIFMILVIVSSLNVNALVPDATMIITNPGEDMSSEINISWHTDVEGTYVLYTVATDTSFSNALAKTGECSAIPFEGKTTTSQCRVTLDNLQSKTEYIYKVGKTNMSSEYKFKTAGDEAFSFIHATDIHSYKSGLSNTRVIAANKVINKSYSMKDDVAFAVFTGDVTAYGTVYEQWETLYTMDTAKKIPYAFAAGNHDYYNSSATVTNINYFNAVTNNPKNGATDVEGSSYFFKYGNALFISLDTEAAAHSSTLLENQKTWFKEVVAANPSDFIIVLTHRPFYTGDGRNASQAQDSRNWFQDLFDEVGVDLVLSGHNHVYARTNQIYNQQVTTIPGKGTVYITGIQIGDRYQSDPGTPMQEVAFAQSGVNQDGTTLFSVSKDKIEIQFISKNGVSTSDGVVVDTAQIVSKSNAIDKTKIMDSLSIINYNDDLSKAKLSFNNPGPGRIYKVEIKNKDSEVLNTYDYPTNSNLNISNIPSTALEYDLNVEMTLRTGEVITKSFNIKNERKYFGTIDNVRLEDVENETYINWDSNLVNNNIIKFQVFVNGEFNNEAESDQESILINRISPYQLNQVELRAIDFEGEVVFTETLDYGIDAPELNLSYEYDEITIDEGDKVTPTYVLFPETDVQLEFTSSDESVATVNEFGEITAVGPGTCTITMNVVRRWDVSSSIEITVNEVDDEEPQPEPEPEPLPEPDAKKGCFGSSGTIVSVGLLGVFIILRRRRIF